MLNKLTINAFGRIDFWVGASFCFNDLAKFFRNVVDMFKII